MIHTPDPKTDRSLYLAAFSEGVDLDAFLAEARANRDMWHAMADRIPAHDDASAQLSELGGRWKVLVLADDWCGDAVNTVPVATRLLEAGGTAEVRIIPRERFPELMDRHLTGGSRSIPILILLGLDGTVRGTWGPRPRDLQSRFESDLRPLASDERYREIRRWYARDRGASTIREIVEMVESAVAVDPKAAAIPCPEGNAA
ncbi:MAG: thioredoxin family protein [Gemmatimonadales bacterium]|nr:MAG: thioredoxin family protein [Gemmatimonadales bacterium]